MARGTLEIWQIILRYPLQLCLCLSKVTALCIDYLKNNVSLVLTEQESLIQERTFPL